MNNIIELKNLKKVYKDTTTVDLKKLTVREGEIYGFLGPNGAGKTTTMKMILSLVEPTLGEILVNGQNIKENKDYLNQIGSMIEEPSYYPNLTGYENLLVFQKMVGFDEDNIWPTLKLVGLAEDKNRKKLVKAYSLGMKQRLALAFALVKKPQILLLDEPTNGLDPAGIHEIRELIVKLAKEEGLTVFISSHILSEIEQIADRVGIINHGCLVYEGEIREIKSNTWIEIGGDFSQNNIVQHLVDFGSVRVREASASEVKLDDMSNDRLADIITYITDLGFRIFRVTRESETLEDIFLELTKEV
ncbi:ABC transporter ATP-binding protein [Streptococcus salivarius]|jgi:ABC-type multidrug transport system ATPase subunit|uniref:ABC transporter, ATP-binding protein n=1 Tax=Streptococcus vestibularis F0396 TaxID=904306 RepID=E3CSL6_STRVE|nr:MULTISPECIES: ABC transporter ATP-binding protein [Streptococcus]EFQ58632.1 ABC transporter, ATP-binding protein [Streptococcus vestibularis F0396]ARC21778.1 ABC transporter ATP-binding protein [Streptococcus sp. FDAARGOS_192]MBK5046699.1 ABC transporter ATP-binding protein [Streptococcus sp. 2.1]MBK5162674.1 ABC transporter ATP-binding protein [Streptococcus sp. 3.1]MBT3131582.1 ABC transporter ATP-binding protein [Streptococcus vestibularis]